MVGVDADGVGEGEGGKGSEVVDYCFGDVGEVEGVLVENLGGGFISFVSRKGEGWHSVWVMLTARSLSSHWNVRLSSSCDRFIALMYSHSPIITEGRSSSSVSRTAASAGLSCMRSGLSSR